MDGLATFYGTVADTLKRFVALLRGTTTGVHDAEDRLPAEFMLYPNPFNPTTTPSVFPCQRRST